MDDSQQVGRVLVVGNSFVRGLTGAVALIIVLGAPGLASAGEAGADLILTHGEFYTPSGWAASIAVKNGVILAVGVVVVLVFLWVVGLLVFVFVCVVVVLGLF